MLEKGSYTLLLQVTADPVGQVITFAANDSLKLNVHNALAGSAAALSAFAPPELDLVPVAPATVLSTTATRIRMISYYIDNTEAGSPELVRRINNGTPDRLRQRQRQHGRVRHRQSADHLRHRGRTNPAMSSRRHQECLPRLPARSTRSAR